MKADPNTEAEILNTMSKVLDAYAQKNVDELLNMFLPHPDVTLIGIGAGKRCVGLENIRSFLVKTFDRPDKIISMELEDPIVSETGAVAWVSTGVKAEFEVEGEPVDIFYRNTTTFKKQNDKWLIAQMHNSAPLCGSE